MQTAHGSQCSAPATLRTATSGGDARTAKPRGKGLWQTIGLMRRAAGSCLSLLKAETSPQV